MWIYPQIWGNVFQGEEITRRAQSTCLPVILFLWWILAIFPKPTIFWEEKNTRSKFLILSQKTCQKKEILILKITKNLSQNFLVKYERELKFFLLLYFWILPNLTKWTYYLWMMIACLLACSSFCQTPPSIQSDMVFSKMIKRLKNLSYWQIREVKLCGFNPFHCKICEVIFILVSH